MSNKLISLAITAALTITGTSAYAASVISSMQTAKPLQMGVADRGGK